MRTRLLFSFLFATAVSLAQSSSYTLPKSLVQYFILTPAQTTSIQQLNQDFDDFANANLKQRSQLIRDAQKELKQASPDAQVVGSKYIEAEMIMRQISQRYSETITAVQAVLTDTQKPKLQALRDALALVPTVFSAQNWYFLEDSGLGSLAGPQSAPGDNSQLSGWERLLTSPREAKQPAAVTE